MKKIINIKINSEKIIAILFIFIIFYMFIGTIKKEHSYIKEEFEKILKNNEKTMYENIVQITTKTESIVNENILFKSKYIDIYGLVQKTIGKRYIVDDVDSTRDIVKTKDYMLSFVQGKEDMQQKAKGIIDLNKQLKENNISLIYVQAPYKIRNNYNLPIGIKDFGNENADVLLEELPKENIDTIDLRGYFEDWDIKDEFFITDHHWKIKPAFEASTYITIELNKKHNFNIDSFYTNIDNYNLINKEKSFLGSIGKRIGKYYSGVDDFEYILPKFETNLVVKKGEQETAGNFEDTVIVKELIEDKDIKSNRYACYFGRDYSEIIIKNKSINTDNKMLIIQDSYGLVFSAMMSLRTSEVRVIDLRHFKQNEIEYINNYNPDIVIIMYNPSIFSVQEAFDFK